MGSEVTNNVVIQYHTTINTVGANLNASRPCIDINININIINNSIYSVRGGKICQTFRRGDRRQDKNSPMVVAQVWSLPIARV